jgi:hypothetical protein
MPEPGLRPSTGITRLRRYHEPLRLPRRPEAHPFGSPGRWSRPTATVDLARCLKDLVHMPTPIPRLERAGSPVGCSPAQQRPSPYVRRVGSSETLSRPAQSSRVSACALAPWLRQGLLRRLQTDDCSPRLLQWLPGRTDNSPDGTCTRWPSRPRRSPHTTQLNSPLTSFRAALTSDVPEGAASGAAPLGLPVSGVCAARA